MDQFQYTLTIKKIDTLKTLKAKEALLRELTSDLYRMYDYSGILSEFNTQEFINTYKCATKLFPLYTGKSLPKFIKDTIVSAERIIVERFMRGTIDEGYDYFINTFEYVSEIYLQQNYISEFEKIIKLIGDNKLPFKEHVS